MNPCAGPPPRMFAPPHPSSESETLYALINDLNNPSTRREALEKLSSFVSKRRESYPDLAPMLWFSFGTVSSLLQEILSAYPAIFPPSLSADQSSAVCNALALMQCMASHPETRSHFLAANIPMFLYPFLNATSTTKPFEFLRLTSLGVIGALVKCDDKEVITYLLQTEIIPLCLRIMENYSDLSKIVATFIMQKILLDDNGLLYACETYERFSHVAVTLGRMVLNIANLPPSQNQSTTLLRHIIRCFLRLAENPRAREALRQCIPEPLINGTFFGYFGEKDPCRLWLCRLARILEPPASQAPPMDERSYGML